PCLLLPSPSLPPRWALRGRRSDPYRLLRRSVPLDLGDGDGDRMPERSHSVIAFSDATLAVDDHEQHLMTPIIEPGEGSDDVLGC
ncbi:MAG: hypothetical protein ACR2FE_11190, partial [Aeromicrobium sp.]